MYITALLCLDFIVVDDFMKSSKHLHGRESN